MEFLTDALAWFTDPEQWSGRNAIPRLLVDHLRLSLTATVVAAGIALPPALWLAHRRRAELAANAVVNIGRAVPSFGVVVLAALLFLTWGIPVRFWATVVALIALALPPMFTNAYAGIRSVDPATVESARGMGLTERQLLLEVELPIAAPIVLAGVRIAMVQVLATATLGAVVGPGGGFGRPIVDGFARGPGGYPEVFGGALLVAVLTIAADRGFTVAERLLPAGVRRQLHRAGQATDVGAV